MPDRSYRVILWCLALLGLAADQASKYGVFAWLHGTESRAYAVFQTEPVTRTFALVPDDTDALARSQQRGFFFEVAFESEENGKAVPHVNHGALFGFLREHKSAANFTFAAISLLAAVAITIWSLQKNTAADRWLCVSLGLILGGTLGNFYDRLMFNGVRDFLHWNYLFDWPVFNVADCCLVVGASLLLLQAFLVPSEKPARTKGEEEQQLVGVGCAAETGIQV